MSQYQLGSGDRINISVFGQDDLSMEIRLPDVGTINYPFLGELKLVGMTAAEVESLIYEGLLGDYLVNPSVSVSIVEYRPFFIDGEVKRPGGYPYQPGLSVNKAAALAGGYTERANRDKITIVRETDGQQFEFSVSVTDMIQPGDIVTVNQRFF
ncbi:polysaccharide export protein [Alteromonas sp. Cnat3-28]|jgi:polysaccharide export outer membrane protein|uniref:polysaccharide biosynthesis/export family protein n=1 Tax=Alteromonas TaxID=226 RepID=UPI001EF73B6B|nr:polysaccharide biosynthesis/export family protein [Alteromonas sp. Cnat3-28]MCG7646036.1 polysaccharide export protein [Alteromonas sp. Cnat3-28]|tara:strand:+ start:498 stop:959 length:462 start_codon:yes stop_codon:yes gene_type:complete